MTVSPKKFGIKWPVAFLLRQCVEESADLIGFYDTARTKSELVHALGNRRPDGHVILTQDELESALWSAVVHEEDGGWPAAGWPSLSELIAQTIPNGYRFDPYFCFILDKKENEHV